MKTRRGNSEQRKAGRSPRETVTLKEHFGRRLAAYAAAAGAAGVGLLAMAEPAKADIVYTPANIGITYPGQTISLDINNDGTNDFSFFRRSYSFHFYSVVLAVSGLAVGDGIMSGAAALPRSARISPSGNFGNFDRMARSIISGPLLTSYPWAYTTNKFLGLEFRVSGQEYFGWAEFSVFRGSFGINATLEGYAYETVAGKSILAGQTTEATPEPGTLGLLALGSLGLGFWRRRKQEPVTSDK